MLSFNNYKIFLIKISYFLFLFYLSNQYYSDLLYRSFNKLLLIKS